MRSYVKRGGGENKWSRAKVHRGVTVGTWANMSSDCAVFTRSVLKLVVLLPDQWLHFLYLELYFHRDVLPLHLKRELWFKWLHGYKPPKLRFLATNCCSMLAHFGYESLASLKTKAVTCNLKAEQLFWATFEKPGIETAIFGTYTTGFFIIIIFFCCLCYCRVFFAQHVDLIFCGFPRILGQSQQFETMLEIKPVLSRSEGWFLLSVFLIWFIYLNRRLT